MEKKTDTVRRLTADGDFKGALRIAKDFRLGITKQESSAMKLAYECMVHGDFYKQLAVMSMSFAFTSSTSSCRSCFSRFSVVRSTDESSEDGIGNVFPMGHSEVQYQAFSSGAL